MAQPSFIFGGNTGISYDELQQRRKVLDAMLSRQSAPQNVGEGIFAFAQGIAGGLEARGLRKVEEEGRKSSTDAFSQAMSAMSSPGSYASAPGASAPIDPTMAAANIPDAASPAGGARAAAETRSAAGEDYVMNYLIGKGLSPQQAAGFTGNLIQESSLNTGARNRGDGRDGSDSIGIAQWNGDRARNLQSFARGTGRDATNIDTQLDFALHEMGLGNQEWSKLPGWGVEGSAGKALRNARDVASAAAAGISYERPAGWSTANPTGGHGWENRYGHANRLAGAGYGAQQQGGPVQVASNDPSAGVAAATAPQTPVQTVAAAMPQPQAQAPSQAVQRVAQAMPQMPAAPNNNIPQEALVALQSPYLSDGQRQALQIAIQQRQAGNNALYERQMAAYEQQVKAAQLQEQRAYDRMTEVEKRAYDASVRQQGFQRDDQIRHEGFQREDARNQYLDARQGSRDARSDMESDRNFNRQVQQDQKPQIIEVFDQATGRAQKGYMDQNQTFVPVGGVQAPTKSNGVVVRGPDGSLVQVGGDTPALTEGQSKDTVYSTRAKGALTTLDQYAPALMDRYDRAKEMVPGGLGREYQNTEYQLAQQAGDEFLQAILRKDTGAAITPGEQSLYGVTYLPQPGDKPDLLAQKQQSRARAVAAIEAGMPASAIVAQEIALRKSGSRTGIVPGSDGNATPSTPKPAAIPEGMDPADWDMLTPEEKRLWQK